MKIAMLSPINVSISPRRYDVRRNLVSKLTKGLTERGIEVSLIGHGYSGTEALFFNAMAQNLEIRPEILDCIHVPDPAEIEGSFDLIHSHFNFLPLAFSITRKIPLAVTIHEPLSLGLLPTYIKYNKKIYYIAVNEADKSPELDYAATIHNGIDTNSFKFSEQKGDYLLFCGGIQSSNAVRECIEIAKKTGIRLVLAGIIKDRCYYKTQVQPYLDNDRIRYAGNVVGEQLKELLAGAYALVYAGGNEGLFVPSALWAMACGTPVVAFHGRYIEEIVENGVTGFLGAEEEDMSQLVLKVKDLDRRKCRERIEQHFSLERMVDDYIRLYEKIIQQTTLEDHRPWGFYQILEDKPDHKVKRITVYPNQRLSYQRHARRSEHWLVISGRGVVTKNGKLYELAAGDSIDLPVKTWHRIQNPGSENLVFIEVQTGDYFGEDDIERSEDDYGRT